MFRKHSKDWSVDNMKKTALNGYVYDFSVDHDAITVNVNKTFTIIWWKKWHNVIKCLGLLKGVFLQD